MADRTDDMSHYWDFSNLSGNTPDKKGNWDITHANDFTLTGESVHYEQSGSGRGDFVGVTDFFDIAGGGKFSFFIQWKLDVANPSNPIFAPAGSTSIRAPLLTYGSIASSLGFSLRGGGSGPTVSWSFSGQPPSHQVDSIMTLGVSWDPDTNTLRATQVKSHRGLAINPVINSAGLAPVASPARIGDNGAWGDITGDYFQMGVIHGETLSQTDLDDTVDAWMQITALAFDGELTSLYEQNEYTGAMQDSIGTKHFASIFNPIFNGTTVTYNGSSAYTLSDNFGSGNMPFDPNSSDYTFYMQLKVLSQVGNVNERWCRPVTLNASDQFLLISPLFNVGGLGDFRVSAHGDTGAAGVAMNMGRDFNVDEDVMVLASYDFTTRQLNAVLRSKDGLNLSAQNTGTTNPRCTAGNAFMFFNNTAGVYSHVELNEVGVIDGTAKSLAQLQTAADEWANPNAAPTGIFNSVVQR